MKNKDLIRAKGFSSQGRSMRQFFDRQFSKAVHSKRFVWDHWYLRDQYKFHRTPAYHYFPDAIYRDFHRELRSFGQNVLGCYDVTPPWLSYYTEGDFQNLHGDIPHGPWAFVYSLTNWKEREFSGGETFLVRESILDFWNHFGDFSGLESEHAFKKISPQFNQLLVFDPRIPHGVTRVEGVHDPREGRLVIHGWFKDPEPYIVGPMTRLKAAHSTKKLVEEVSGLLHDYDVLHGTQSYKIEISQNGKVHRVVLLTDTLRMSSPSTKPKFLRNIKKLIANFHFPKSKGKNILTLPLIYKF